MVVLGGGGAFSYERGTPVGIQDSAFEIRDSGFGIRVSGFRFRVPGSGIQNPGFEVRGLGLAGTCARFSRVSLSGGRTI